MNSTPTPSPIATAAEWLTALQAQDLSLRDRERFAEWLRRSPVHVDEFLRLTALQGHLTRWPGLHDIDLASLEAEVAQGGAAVVPLAALPPEAAASIDQPRRLQPVWRFAATAAVVLAAAAWSFVEHPAWFGGAERYVTAVGEQRSVTLADGSHVQLNVRSDLSARVDEHARDLQLEAGEALFKVAQDSARPFRVHTPQAVIEALGTEFNVHVAQGRTIVTLLEGRVAVTPAASASGANQSIALQPGQQLQVAGDAAAIPRPQPGDPAAAMAWTQRRLVFDNAPLAQVAAEFNRYSRQSLVVNDPRLRDARITAVFDADDIQAFVDSLMEAGRFEVTRQPNGAWHIEPHQQK